MDQCYDKAWPFWHIFVTFLKNFRVSCSKLQYCCSKIFIIIHTGTYQRLLEIGIHLSHLICVFRAATENFILITSRPISESPSPCPEINRCHCLCAMVFLLWIDIDAMLLYVSVMMFILVLKICLVTVITTFKHPSHGA